MTRLPHKISIMDAARLFNTPVGIVARDMRIKNPTGQEVLVTADLMKRFKCPKELFKNLVSGADKALTKAQAAAMLGLRPHVLHIYHHKRASIVPVLALGDGNGRGLRFSRKAVEAHLALEAARGIPPAQPLYQPQNEPQAVPA